MRVVRVEDPVEFAARTRDFLLRDEARHNLILGLTRTLIDQPSQYPEFRLWIVEDAGEVFGAALWTPPFNLVVSRPAGQHVLGVLADGLTDQRVRLPGVGGSTPEVDEFAERWSDRARVEASVSMEQAIYRLGMVRPVSGVSGSMREATKDDRGLLVEWTTAFAEEADPEQPRASEGMVDGRLEGAGAGLVLWEDGDVVSLAGYGGGTPNGIRIGPVYTPPGLRRRGYASALVAALSRRLLDEGRTFCFLYTDLANPTSNRIYQRIGYERACDSRMYRFVER